MTILHNIPTYCKTFKEMSKLINKISDSYLSIDCQVSRRYFKLWFGIMLNINLKLSVKNKE